MQLHTQNNLFFLLPILDAANIIGAKLGKESFCRGRAFEIESAHWTHSSPQTHTYTNGTTAGGIDFTASISAFLLLVFVYLQYFKELARGQAGYHIPRYSETLGTHAYLPSAQRLSHTNTQRHIFGKETR